MSQETHQKTIKVASLAALGAAILTVLAAHTVSFASLGVVTPVALAALAFLVGSSTTASTRCLARRPVLGAVGLVGLVPVLPDPEQLALVGAFAVAGLLMATLIGPIVAAFARERLAAISGSLGLGLIAYTAFRAGLVVGPTMQVVLALCAITATLAVASALVAAPQRANG